MAKHFDSQLHMLAVITDQLTKDKRGKKRINISTFNGNRAVSRCFCLWQCPESRVPSTIWQPGQIMMDSRLELPTIHRRRTVLNYAKLVLNQGN